MGYGVFHSLLREGVKDDGKIRDGVRVGIELWCYRGEY
jgi:hypothetical protein